MCRQLNCCCTVLLLLLPETFAQDACNCCTDRSPGDISDDDDVRDYQDFSSNDDLSDIDASDERQTHLRKLHATRLNFTSQVCFPTLPCWSKFVNH